MAKNRKMSNDTPSRSEIAPLHCGKPVTHKRDLSLRNMTPDQKAAYIAREHQRLIDSAGGNTAELKAARRSHATSLRRISANWTTVPEVSPAKQDKPRKPRATLAEAQRLRNMLTEYMLEVPEAPLFDSEGRPIPLALRNRIRFEHLLETLYQRALAGDTGMMKLVIERIIPLHKTAELSVQISAGEHLAFLNRMRHGDTVLRFGGEQSLSNIIDQEPPPALESSPAEEEETAYGT